MSPSCLPTKNQCYSCFYFQPLYRIKILFSISTSFQLDWSLRNFNSCRICSRTTCRSVLSIQKRLSTKLLLLLKQQQTTLFEISDEWIEEMRTELPEFPKERSARYVSQLGLSDYDARSVDCKQSHF